MDESEAGLVWPNILHPQGSRRSIVLRTSSGIKTIELISLIVLVNDRLYVVEEERAGLKIGQVIARKTSDSEEPFRVYYGLDEARAALGRVLKKDKLWSLQSALPEEQGRFVWQGPSGERLIPPLSERIDLTFDTRLQAMRGIGRLLDWRAVVLENVADQIRVECRRVQETAKQTFCSPEVAGKDHPHRELRKRAMQLNRDAGFFRNFQIKPFNRGYVHLARELDEASRYLLEATGMKSKEAIIHARLRLSRIYRSITLLEQYCRLEEWLLVILDHRNRGESLTAEKSRLCLEELTDIHRLLTSPDALTQRPIDEGFRPDILPVVTGYIFLSCRLFDNPKGVDLVDLCTHLQAACHPHEIHR